MAESVLKSTRVCDIFGRKYDARYYKFNDSLIMPVYDDNHIRIKKRNDNRTELRTYDPCPTCTNLIIDYIERMLHMTGNQPEFLGKQLNIKKD